MLRGAKMANRLNLRKIVLLAVMAIIACGPKPNNASQNQQYIDKGNQQIGNERFSDAIKNFHRALKNDEKNPEIYRKIAFCFEKQNLPDSAVSYYEGAIVFFPKDIDSYQRIGDIYFNEKNYNEAMSWYERGMDLGRLQESSYRTLGNINLRWREYKKAQEYFQRAVEADSTKADSYYGLGLAQLQLRDTTAASASFEKSVQIGSEPKAAYFLGMIYYTQNDIDQAKKWLTIYIQKEPAGDYSAKADGLLQKISGK
jgi:tetratricopeptide (TPR) repeat protein